MSETCRVGRQKFLDRWQAGSQSFPALNLLLLSFLNARHSDLLGLFQNTVNVPQCSTALGCLMLPFLNEMNVFTEVYTMKA